jgi:mRNA interferase RelE/StbE
MTTQIIFSQKATKELKKLDQSIQKRIDSAIKKKLEKDPNNYLIPLTGSLQSLHKFRVGDYRLICKKENKQLLILVITVKHRKEVYDILN